MFPPSTCNHQKHYKMGFTKTILREGSGPQVQRGQNVTVHCTGEL